MAGEKHRYIAMVLFSDGSENTYFQYYKYYNRAVRRKWMSRCQIVTPPLYNSICKSCGKEPYGWLKPGGMGLSEDDYKKEGGYMQDGAIIVCPHCGSFAEFRWK